ncbi:MAG TPA: type II secretion system F family protein [Candidatus Ozemobacteraceae bacterium]|nr:type II secretion system F family protein [Candidatus Ozemobacteraceae bacterium]
MNEQQQNSHEIITFCQLLAVALKSGRPIPETLAAIGTRSGSSKASQWAVHLADKMSEGHPVEDACRELTDFDPVLARLMPLLGNNRLLKILELYTGFLVNLERVRESLKTALFYPAVVVTLLLAQLMHLNFSLFPHVYEQAAALSSPLPMTVRLLYFASFDLWPISLPIPLLMIISAIFMLRTFFSAKIDSRSLAARFARFGEALQLQETGRLQGVISLYLEAGFPLAVAIENAAGLTHGRDSDALLNVAEALKHGEGPASAFALSPALKHVGSDKSDAGSLAERLKYASESNYRHSYSLLKSISNEMLLIALLITGLFVGLVASGVFGSYYWALWSI